MGTYLFNPSCPHADPVNAGVDQMGQRCGTCINVPRAWLLICGVVSGVYSAMGGKFVLTRDLKAFRTDGSQDCRWSAKVQLNPSFARPIGIWSLFYAQGLGYWEAWADMSDNNPADIDTYGPNAINFTPDVGFSPPAWNCLGPNTLPIANGGLGFPATIIVQPYWP